MTATPKPMSVRHVAAAAVMGAIVSVLGFYGVALPGLIAPSPVDCPVCEECDAPPAPVAPVEPAPEPVAEPAIAPQEG